MKQKNEIKKLIFSLKQETIKCKKIFILTFNFYNQMKNYMKIKKPFKMFINSKKIFYKIKKLSIKNLL